MYVYLLEYLISVPGLAGGKEIVLGGGRDSRRSKAHRSG